MAEPINFDSPGMFQGPGLLKAREAYGRYAADVMSRGEQPATFEVWMKALQAQQTPATAATAMPMRGAPTSGIVQRMQAGQDAELAARQDEQLRIMREAQRKARERRVIQARAGQVY